MLRPGQRALTFPRATLKARIAHGPLGYPLFSSFLSSSLSVPFPESFSRQTPRRSSQGVKKHLSDRAPISLLSNDLRLSRPQLSGASTAPGRALSLFAAAAALPQAPAHRGARL